VWSDKVIERIHQKNAQKCFACFKTTDIWNFALKSLWKVP
jgi:hypothetical protein